MKATMNFYCNCVGWPRDKVNQLISMIDANITITRRTFLKHINRDDLKALEHDLGYGRGWLHMASDYCVSYHRSKLEGKTVYYFNHSLIEYVFTP